MRVPARRVPAQSSSFEKDMGGGKGWMGEGWREEGKEKGTHGGGDVGEETVGRGERGKRGRETADGGEGVSMVG